jgi:hypothetical protein
MFCEVSNARSRARVIEKGEDIVALVTAIGPVNEHDDQLIAAISTMLGLAQHKVHRTLNELTESGVLLRRGRLISLHTPVIGNVILRDEALSPSGVPTGYVPDVVEHFGALQLNEILRNISELEWWEGMNGTRPRLLGFLWDRLRVDYNDGDYSRRWRLLHGVREVAQLQPSDGLGFFRYVATQASDSLRNEQLRELLCDGLRRVAYHSDYIRDAAELLWRLAIDETGSERSRHAIRALSDLARNDADAYGWIKPAWVQLAMLEIVERRLDTPGGVRVGLEVLRAVLGRIGEANRLVGDSLRMNSFLVRPDAESGVRARAASVLWRLADAEDPKLIDNCVALYEDLARPVPIGVFGMVPSDDAQRSWIPERLDAISGLAKLLERSPNDVLRLRIRSTLSALSDEESFEEIRDASSKALSRVTATIEERVSQAVVDGWGHTRRSRRDYAPDDDESWRANLARLAASEWTPEAFVTFLSSTLEDAAILGRPVSPGPFLATIGRSAPDYAADVFRAASREERTEAIDWLGALLAGVFDADPGNGRSLLGIAARAQMWRLRRVAAGSVVFHIDTDDELQGIFAALLSDEDARVRIQAIGSLQWLSHKNPALCQSLIESLPVEDLAASAAVVAEALYFTREHGFNDSLLRKFAAATTCARSLDGHWVEEMLGIALTELPVEVVRLLLDRIARHENDMRFEALPYQLPQVDLSRISKRDDYDHLLRLVRDAVTSDRLWSSDAVPRMFVMLALPGHPAVGQVLNEFVQTGESERILVAAVLVSAFPSEFLFEHADVVEEVLEAAMECGGDCYEHVSSTLLPMGEVRSGRRGKPFPEDLDLRERAAAMAEKYEQMSATWRFWRNVVRFADDSIARKAQRDAEWEA